MPVQSRPETAPRTVSVEIEEGVVRSLRAEASRRNVPVTRLIREYRESSGESRFP
jgi:hypothetical protein